MSKATRTLLVAVPIALVSLGLLLQPADAVRDPGPNPAVTAADDYSIWNMDFNGEMRTSVRPLPSSGVRGGTAPLPRYRVQLQKVARSVRWLTGIASAGDDRLFVLQQRGYIRILAPDGTFQADSFLDISDRVGWQDNWEQGLLGLAFHPDHAANGYFYVTYTGRDGDLRLSRFRADQVERGLPTEGVREQADPASEVVILDINEPEGDHNGGGVQFGPDGYLYLGVGDGGAHYPSSAQDGGNLRGTILRLDVDSGEPYAVPLDNPFLGAASVRDEIWLLGLRNPWRFSFDSANGDLFIGDVGAERFEEIDYLAAANRAGGRNTAGRASRVRYRSSRDSVTRMRR